MADMRRTLSRSAHLTINCLAHVVLISHLLPILEKTSLQHPDADVRLVLQASEMHRTTLGGPSENFGGDKFRSTEEFKAGLVDCSAPTGRGFTTDKSSGRVR